LELDRWLCGGTGVTRTFDRPRDKKKMGSIVLPGEGRSFVDAGTTGRRSSIRVPLGTAAPMVCRTLRRHSREVASDLRASELGCPVA
jgi:hypothetical protein